MNNLPFDFVVDRIQQELPEFVYEVPAGWQEEYDIQPRHKSISGLCQVVMGMDNFHLFPNKVTSDDQAGIVLSRSQLTGNLLIAGRAITASTEEIYHNRMVSEPVICNELQLSPEPVVIKEETKVEDKKDEEIAPADNQDDSRREEANARVNSEENCKPTPGGMVLHYNGLPPGLANSTQFHQEDIAPQSEENGEIERSIKSLYSTADILVSPQKRCNQCKNCKVCKRTHLPEMARQIDQIEMIKNNISFDSENAKYTAKYAYNSYLPSLPDYRIPTMTMMQQLEKKLARLDLTEQFNDVISDFFSRGVIDWVSNTPDIDDKQVSFIPLTFTLDPHKTTKLRICSNSSFKTGKEVSLNGCMISGPQYLVPMQDILLRWRMAQECALGDIRHCYHSVASNSLDKSLRRIHLKPGGMNSNTEWKEACFQTISFGEVQGGSFAQLCVLDSGLRFIKRPSILTNMSENTYMDDCGLFHFGGSEDPPLQTMVADTDTALQKGGFHIKKWTFYILIAFWSLSSFSSARVLL